MPRKFYSLMLLITFYSISDDITIIEKRMVVLNEKINRLKKLQIHLAEGETLEQEIKTLENEATHLRQDFDQIKARSLEDLRDNFLSQTGLISILKSIDALKEKFQIK